MEVNKQKRARANLLLLFGVQIFVLKMFLFSFYLIWERTPIITNENNKILENLLLYSEGHVSKNGLVCEYHIITSSMQLENRIRSHFIERTWLLAVWSVNFANKFHSDSHSFLQLINDQLLFRSHYSVSILLSTKQWVASRYYSEHRLLKLKLGKYKILHQSLGYTFNRRCIKLNDSNQWPHLMRGD